MNPNADPRMATVLSGISRLVSDFGDQGALTLILQNDAGKALLDSMHNVSRAASMLEKGPPIPLFAMTGPTGVGKTSLLNAILQQEVADVSWRRPTTIEPLLHLFGSQPVAELPENIRNCPSAPHDIDFLSNMLIVDIPDLNIVNTTVGLRSESLLDQADVVLIVGSPEQCGNQSVWELIRKKSATSAFVFVLNKCDQLPDGIGVGLAFNWMTELAQLGFASPIMHQLSCRWALDSAACKSGYDSFHKFRDWVSGGVCGKTLESVRRRRLNRALNLLAAKIEATLLTDARLRWRHVEKEWVAEIQAEAGHLSETVMEGLDRRSDEMEGFLEADLRDRLRGIMALWLRLFGRGRSGGGGLLTGGWRAMLGQLALGGRESAANSRDQASRLALEPAIDGSGADRRRIDLMDRLAGRVIDQDLPVDSVRASFSNLAQSPWRDPLLAQARTVLDEFEGRRLASGGVRGLIRDMSIGLANYLPPIGLLGILSWPVILFFDPMGWKRTPQLFDLFLPALGLVLMLMGLQALLSIVMPFQWPAIRAELRQRLRSAKAVEMEREYLAVLVKSMAEMEEHSKRLLELAARARDLARAADSLPGELGSLEALFARPLSETSK